MNKSLLAVFAVLAAVMAFIASAQEHAYLSDLRYGQELATRFVVANVYEARMNSGLAAIMRMDPERSDAAATLSQHGYAFTENLSQLAPLVSGDAAGRLTAIKAAWGACGREYTSALAAAGPPGTGARTRAVADARACFVDVNVRFAALLSSELDRTASQDGDVRDRMNSLLTAVIIPSLLLSVSANGVVLLFTILMFPVVGLLWTTYLARTKLPARAAAKPAATATEPSAAQPVAPAAPTGGVVSIMPHTPGTGELAMHDEHSPEFKQNAHRVVDDIKHFHAIGNDLRALIEATVPDITHLVHSVHRVRGNISAAQKVAEAAILAVSMGEETLREGLAGTATSVMATMNDVHDRVQDLQARAAEVAAVVRLVGEIAEQTHLLALKTAVKAANAGDAGKGLAIVSGAVVKLTDQGAEQARTALELVAHIRKSAADVVHDLETSAIAAKQNTETAVATVNTLGSIRTDMRALATHLQGVTAGEDIVPETGMIEGEVEKMRETLGTMMHSLEAINESTSEIADALYESLHEQGAVEEVEPAPVVARRA